MVNAADKYSRDSCKHHRYFIQPGVAKKFQMHKQQQKSQNQFTDGHCGEGRNMKCLFHKRGKEYIGKRPHIAELNIIKWRGTIIAEALTGIVLENRKLVSAVQEAEREQFKRLEKEG